MAKKSNSQLAVEAARQREAQPPMTLTELEKWATEAQSMSKWSTPRVAAAILMLIDSIPEPIEDPRDDDWANVTPEEREEMLSA